MENMQSQQRIEKMLQTQLDQEISQLEAQSHLDKAEIYQLQQQFNELQASFN